MSKSFFNKKAFSLEVNIETVQYISNLIKRKRAVINHTFDVKRGSSNSDKFLSRLGDGFPIPPVIAKEDRNGVLHIEANDTLYWILQYFDGKVSFNGSYFCDIPGIEQSRIQDDMAIEIYVWKPGVHQNEIDLENFHI